MRENMKILTVQEVKARFENKETIYLIKFQDTDEEFITCIYSAQKEHETDICVLSGLGDWGTLYSRSLGRYLNIRTDLAAAIIKDESVCLSNQKDAKKVLEYVQKNMREPTDLDDENRFDKYIKQLTRFIKQSS